MYRESYFAAETISKNICMECITGSFRLSVIAYAMLDVIPAFTQVTTLSTEGWLFIVKQNFKHI